MTRAIVSVGSNQNDPHVKIQTAYENLSIKFPQTKISRLYLTEPVGDVVQDAFVNAAISLETELSASELLDYLVELENKAERDRESEIPKGPRNLDLDIIFFGNEAVQQTDLEIPHPRFRERRFVLEPLAEIAASFIDPITGNSVAKLLADCTDSSWVKLFEGQTLEA